MVRSPLHRSTISPAPSQPFAVHCTGHITAGVAPPVVQLETGFCAVLAMNSPGIHRGSGDGDFNSRHGDLVGG
eukprot:s65_g38.t1